MKRLSGFETDLKRALEPVKVSFHVPGHKYGQAQRYGGYPADGCYGLDTTEIPGTDNLHEAEGIIQAAQQRASDVFGSRETYFLVNGSTSGVLAMILSAVGPGEKLLMGRDAHQSAFHGAWLAQAEVAWLMPEYDPATLLNLGVSTDSVRQALNRNPDAKALLLTSPTYYGLCSDLEAIGALCREKGVLLLVDEAHGAHLSLSSKLPQGALMSGADLCVQSTHKTLPALTQSAMLHVGSDRVDREKLRWMLRMVQTSSPSYLLMRSLDQATEMAGAWGQAEMARLLWDIERLRERLSPVPGLLEGPEVWKGRGAVRDADPTKLVLRGAALGCSGAALSEQLREGYGIQMELSTPWHSLGIAAIGNGSEDMEALGTALLDLAAARGRLSGQPFQAPLPPSPPEAVMAWRTAADAPKRMRTLKDSIGYIAGGMVTPYPPGIPALMPGERISEATAAYLAACLKAGLSIIGLAPGSDGHIPTVDSV